MTAQPPGGRRMTVPANVTGLGVIAYCLDAIAADLADFADSEDRPDLNALARRLWGAMDDLVTYNLKVKARPPDDEQEPF